MGLVVKGVARKDYARPCPGCNQPIFTGQDVVGIPESGSEFKTWWHRDCHGANVAKLARVADIQVEPLERLSSDDRSIDGPHAYARRMLRDFLRSRSP